MVNQVVQSASTTNILGACQFKISSIGLPQTGVGPSEVSPGDAQKAFELTTRSRIEVNEILTDRPVSAASTTTVGCPVNILCGFGCHPAEPAFVAFLEDLHIHIAGRRKQFPVIVDAQVRGS